MNPDVLILAKLSAAFLALFAMAELLYHRAHFPAEHTRKVVHFGTGLLTLLFPVLLHYFWQVAVLCGSFLLLLLTSMRLGWLPSINAVPRKTWGSVLYPLIVAGVFWFYSAMRVENGAVCNPLLYFYLPILIMAVCDPLAALVGQRVANRRNRKGPGKTSAGSVTFFGSALLVSMLLLMAFCEREASILHMFVTTGILAVSTTLAERWSTRGWDNFTIPATAAACLFLLRTGALFG